MCVLTTDMILAYLADGGGTATHPADHVGNTGRSGGGFDRLSFKLGEVPEKVDHREFSTSIDLTAGAASGVMVASAPLRRGHVLRIGVPAHHGGQGQGHAGLGDGTCTGEGGYPAELVPYSENVITR